MIGDWTRSATCSDDEEEAHFGLSEKETLMIQLLLVQVIRLSTSCMTSSFRLSVFQASCSFLICGVLQRA